MVKDLAKWAHEKGVKYFMISYTDLFGAQRAKLVPAQAINDMAVEGAGFAGFATWLDLTPAHPDLMAVPDPTSVIQLPWKKEVAWVAARATMEGKLVKQTPPTCWSIWWPRRRRTGCASRPESNPSSSC